MLTITKNQKFSLRKFTDGRNSGLKGLDRNLRKGFVKRRINKKRIILINVDDPMLKKRGRGDVIKIERALKFLERVAQKEIFGRAKNG